MYLSLTFKLQGRKHAAGFPCVFFSREFYLVRNKDCHCEAKDVIIKLI